MIATWKTGRSEQRWSDVLGHAADDVNHYLFVDGCTAIVVPRHAIAAFQAAFERRIPSIRAL